MTALLGLASKALERFSDSGDDDGIIRGVVTLEPYEMKRLVPVTLFQPNDTEPAVATIQTGAFVIIRRHPSVPAEHTVRVSWTFDARLWG